MSEESASVQLGDKTYKVVPQRIGRIQRKLREVFELPSGNTDVQEVGPRLREALEVFIPDIDPLWRLQGYPTAAAFTKDQEFQAEAEKARQEHAQKWYDAQSEETRAELTEAPPFEFLPAEVQAEYEPPKPPEDLYDEEADASPTPPQIITAVETIFKIHGGERLVNLLGKVVSEDALKGAVERQVVLWQGQQASREVALLRLRNSPPGNGASPPTPSTTPPPTETATPSDSHQLASSTS